MNSNLNNSGNVSLSANITIKRFNPSEDSKLSLINLSCGTGINLDGNIYCFYGLFLDNEKLIGFVKYEVVEDLPIISLDRIEIEPNFQRMGYGRELLARSLEDLVSLFAYIRSVRVLSSTKAIEFYKHNGFVPYYENPTNSLTLTSHLFIKHLF
jgi:ribosomal protein S18 acetylase RimI-like enzyme